MGQKCTCSAKSNCAEWDPLEECDVLIESIQNETDIRKIAETSHRCLKLMSMNDACEFMVKHQYPITFENIIKFKELTMKFYNIRLEIMKQLILNSCFFFVLVIKMSEFYDVYVGNLSVAISQENLRDLFCGMGRIAFVWIKMAHQRFTYAFVAFYYLDDAKKAWETLNNRNLDGLIIKVNLSIRTQQKLVNSVKKRTDTILLELPKRTGKKIETKADRLKKILTADIKKQDKKFVYDFTCALKEADNISCKPCEIIKTEPEKTNLQTLETLVLRYYQPVEKKNNLFKEIDIDISKHNVLKSTLNAKYFDIFRSKK